MPTSLPITPSRSRAARPGRRPLLGWSWTDWALFVASYGVIFCAILFAAPAQKAPRADAPAIMQTTGR